MFQCNLGAQTAASHKVHDFQPVILAQPHLVPSLPVGDFPIQLHCDAIAFESEGLDELRK